MQSKILLLAFACNPNKGSESSYGWNWSKGLAEKGYQVHCLTREVEKNDISAFESITNVTFHFIKLPYGLERLYGKSQAFMYLYYLLWQYFAYLRAKKLHKIHSFSLAHHVTWGSVQLGSFIYKIPIPFIFGPAGGGQIAPLEFKKYFDSSWGSEEKRETVSNLLLKFNPAAKKMYSVAKTIWVSNPETEILVKKYGAINVQSMLDAALPDSFFPNPFTPKIMKDNKLNLLWVGRLMPRKGILLVLDVMNSLKDYENITLTVVGDGEQRDIFLKTIKELGLSKNVIWKGKVPYQEVKEFYNSHDAFFIASLRDSGPSQLIEAMAYGLPIVTINIHGQSFIVNDDTGFRCACNTAEEAILNLKSSILKLYTNPNLLTKMSISAHEFALKQNWNSKIDEAVKRSYVNNLQ